MLQYSFDYSHYPQLLDTQIKEYITEKYICLSSSGTNIIVYVNSELTELEEQELDVLISNHSTSFQTDFNYLMSVSEKTQEQNINFGRTLLHDFMRKNIIEGMNIKQSLWVFARFEEFTISCDFGSKRVDFFKMFQSGAIPTAYYCLSQVAPDTMTETYHWLNQERLDWIKVQIQGYLGPGMVAYIDSLV